MGSIDLNNSTIIPLNVADNFQGAFTSTTNFSEICISVETDTKFSLTVNFSSNANDITYTKNFFEPTPSQDAFIYRIQPYLGYYFIVLANDDIVNQTYLRVNTIQKNNIIYQETGNTPASNVAITNPLNQDGSVFVGGNLALTGSVNANITNASLDVSDADTHTKLDNIQTQLEKSNKGSIPLWASNITGVNGTSLIADLTGFNQTNLTIFGVVNGATQLVVQFSDNGILFFDSQYSYTQSGSGDYGFNIQASPKYLRLKSTNSVTASAFLNYN